MRKFTAVELYAGIARTWEPFRSWNRCRLGLLVDIDPFAAATYKVNHPTAPYIVQDLAAMTPDEVRRLTGGRVDILLGCPPCQGFSDSGKRNPADLRNDHMDVFARFATALEPLVVVMENVPLAATSSQFTRLIQALERRSYSWVAGIVNAALYGSCQTRQRLLLIAVRKSITQEPFLPAPTHGGGRRYFHYGQQKMMRLLDDPVGLLGAAPGTGRASKIVRSVDDLAVAKEPIPYLREVLEDLPPIGSRLASPLSHTPWRHSPRMIARMERVSEGGQWRGGRDHFSHSYGRLHQRGLCRTITSYFSNPGSGRFWHPMEPRALTLREAARVQGIEDTFKFNGFQSRAAQLVGNALDRAIAEASYRVVRNLLGG